MGKFGSLNYVFFVIFFFKSISSAFNTVCSLQDAQRHRMTLKITLSTSLGSLRTLHWKKLLNFSSTVESSGYLMVFFDKIEWLWEDGWLAFPCYY